jgi:hypothetical protein
MSEPLFDIIFRGDIVLGRNIADVKSELGKLFKVDAAKVERLFSGVAKPLKRGLNQAQAEKYKHILMKAGALIEIKPVETAQVAKPEAPAKKIPLAERLAAQEAAAESADTTPASSHEDLSAPLSGPAQTLDLAPVGESLLRDSERAEPEALELEIPLVSIRESGEDLLDASERTEFVPLELDLSALLLADAGEDLIAESERIKPEVTNVEIGEMDLAPVGSDMGQIEKEPPPPPPDTSALSLSE